uniref:Uncharacterized protein n=1 Tax=viral metagenome TaxID=1070528 RepID=A0A6M3XST5_9ZZZZ
MTDATYTLVCDILRKSNDGNDLSDLQLKLTEMAVNNQLNERGFIVLRGLQQRLTDEDRCRIMTAQNHDDSKGESRIVR